MNNDIDKLKDELEEKTAIIDTLNLLIKEITDDYYIEDFKDTINECQERVDVLNQTINQMQIEENKHLENQYWKEVL